MFFFSVNLRGRLFLPPHDINPRHFIFLFFFQLFLHDDDNVERTTKWPIETARERERGKKFDQEGALFICNTKGQYLDDGKSRARGLECSCIVTFSIALEAAPLFLF